MVVVKNTKNLGTIIIKPIERKIAKDLIIKNHYSHKFNSAHGKINIGIFKDDCPNCLGVASFGHMMNPKSYKSISDDLNEGEIIELNRLWIDDCLGHNAESIFLGGGWKILRADYPHIKCVQSFADGRLGCGTIYKATNFKYFGFHKSLFYENTVKGEVLHKVPMEDTSNMTMAHYNALWCKGEFKPFVVNTYRYIYPLRKVNFKIKEKPYPEYNKGIEYLTDYKHNPNLIFKSLCIAYMAGMADDFDVLLKWIKTNIDRDQYKHNMDIALANKFIIAYGDKYGKNKIDELAVILNDTRKGTI